MMNPYVMAKELPENLQKLVNDPNFTYAPLWAVLLVTLFFSALCGLWNGLLVAYAKIQPMVATLILMIAGRGIAQLITNGIRIQIFYEPYAFIGNGWVVLPFPVYVVIFMFLLLWFFTRKTSVGLFIESVGVNARSSYFSGIDEKKIKLLAYMLCGLFAGMAGILASANIKTSDANNIGWALELDAILAVVIGGTMMSGGRFSLFASVVGALVMQATTTSMYAIGVPPNAVLAVKGVVVFLVLLLYSEQVRGFIRRLTTQKKGV
jgi:simple sugar transport system permease protein